ncbi:MAG: alpha/beta fold hydrolase [Proteobacteria bacterium]|nr:alpha/beta fold hydrolase [Pseudomonadota bacterium]
MDTHAEAQALSETYDGERGFIIEAESAKKEEASDDPVQILAFSCPVDHGGSSVFVQGWTRPQSEQPPVIFVHDLGENVELYTTAAELLVRQGFNVFSFDQRGHGRSSPLTNQVVRFQDLVNDLLQVVAWIRHKSQRRMPFLIGQGVGALVLMHFQKAYPQYSQRCILLAPTIQEQTVLPLFSRLLISGMAQFIPAARLPQFFLPYFLPLSDESRERGLEHKLLITARFAQELLQAIRKAAQVFSSLNQTNLVICPIDDPLYSSVRLQKLIDHHPCSSSLEIWNLGGISSQVLTRDGDGLEHLFEVLVPWMRDKSARASTL